MTRRVLFVLACVATGCSDNDSDAVEGALPDATLSDDFDAPELQGWRTFGGDSATTRVEDGSLVIEPAPQSLWFNDRSAFLLHKDVEGDFVMTAPVSVRKLSEPTSPPDVPFRLGGIMARDPGRSGGENYVFIVLGADGDDVSVETKSTTRSRSTFEGPPFPGAQAELRICRLGPRFSMLVRGSDGAWQQQAVFDRPDLPSTLQLGPMAYANVPDPDVQARFDAVQFAPATDPEDCTATR